MAERRKVRMRWKKRLELGVLMKVTLDGKKVAAGKAASVGELLAGLKVSTEEALVKVNGKLSPESTVLSAKDEVKVIRVIFGG